MKFDELDEKMREYETASDRRVLPDVFIAARIDGRNFTRLTKETCKFEAPFDVRFRDLMIETTKHLMTCGFDALYGYSQSDEISLLLAKEVKTELELPMKDDYSLFIKRLLTEAAEMKS